MVRVVGSLEIPESASSAVGSPPSNYDKFYTDPTDGITYVKNPAGIAVPVGFRNPMTTADDIIKGGPGGGATRVAKGNNNTVWGVNAVGSLRYMTITPAQLAAAIPRGQPINTIGSGASLVSVVMTPISGSSVVNSTGRDIDIECWVRGHNAFAGQSTQVKLFYNSTEEVGEVGMATSSNANDFWTMSRSFRIPSLNDNTYAFQMYGLVSGGVTLLDALEIHASERAS